MEAAFCKKAVEYVESEIPCLIENTFKITNSVLQNPLENKDLAMCIISNLVYYYDDTDYINNFITNWDMEYKLIVLEKLVYIIFYNKNYIFIVFKGTTEFKEVLSDLDFIQIEDSYNIPGKIHRGFHNLILKNNVIDSIKKTLENLLLDKENVEIIITGHSLGAALATIFYSYISDVYDAELITFGSPRVGDLDFSEKIKCTRFVHGNDIITKLPIFKYKHAEKIVRLGNIYSYRVFTDHFLEGYYTELIKKTSLVD